MKAQHALFVESYCKNRNLTQAAKDAGYAAGSASVQGGRLIKNPSIAAAVAAHDAATSSKSKKSERKNLELTKERVMEELATIALFDPADMYDPETGALLDVKDMPEHTRRALAGIEETISSRGDKNTKLRISSKLGGLELIAKIIGAVKQADTFAPVQIIIGAPPELPAPVDNSKLLPEWK